MNARSWLAWGRFATRLAVFGHLHPATAAARGRYQGVAGLPEDCPRGPDDLGLGQDLSEACRRARIRVTHPGRHNRTWRRKGPQPEAPVPKLTPN